MLLFEMVEHLDGKGLTSVWDVLPALDLVEDPLNDRCKEFLYLVELA
jgi:hypothetical protein